MFPWEPEGHYCCTKSMAIAPFWFATEHPWTVLMPCWLSDFSSLQWCMGGGGWGGLLGQATPVPLQQKKGNQPLFIALSPTLDLPPPQRGFLGKPLQVLHRPLANLMALLGLTPYIPHSCTLITTWWSARFTYTLLSCICHPVIVMAIVLCILYCRDEWHC